MKWLYLKDLLIFKLTTMKILEYIFRSSSVLQFQRWRCVTIHSGQNEKKSNLSFCGPGRLIQTAIFPYLCSEFESQTVQGQLAKSFWEPYFTFRNFWYKKK